MNLEAYVRIPPNSRESVRCIGDISPCDEMGPDPQVLAEFLNILLQWSVEAQHLPCPLKANGASSLGREENDVTRSLDEGVGVYHSALHRCSLEY